MDCRTAQDWLELVRPDSDDLAASDLSDAVAHLQTCEVCEQVFVARQAADRALSARLCDVPVPEGLHASLLEAIAAAAAPQATIDTVSPTRFSSPPMRVSSPAKSSEPAAPSEPATSAPAPVIPEPPSARPAVRRAPVRAIAVAAAVMLTVSVWWLWPGTGASFSMLAVQQATMAHEAGVPFDGNFRPRLPQQGWRTASLRLAREPAGLALAGPRHDIAVWQFELPMARRAPVSGRLLVIPARRLAEQIDATDFASAPVEYLTGREGRLSLAAWREDAWVYVCVVDGTGDDLQRLRSAMALPPA